MYRSRPVVLVLFAAAAACSTRDDSAAVAPLAQDTTLARLSVRQEGGPPLPAVCSAVTIAAANPAGADKPQAKELARQAYDAELLGHVQEAQSLLRHASELDGTDESLAYHLGRTSEALGDHAGATTAYCHYLILAPTTAGADDVRQRVARLAQSQLTVAANGAPSTLSPRPGASGSVQHAVRARSPGTRRVVAVAARSSSTTTRLPQRAAQSTGAILGAEDDSPDADGGAHRSASNGEVVATSSDVPTVTRSSTTPPARSRRPTRVQGAGLGAVAGAIIGAATGRSVKSAAIGAAAGGIIGTVVAGGSR